MCGEAMLVPDRMAYEFVGYDDRTLTPGATMSGLIRVPWKLAGPRLLKVARLSLMSLAPTVYVSSYWAVGPSLPTVRHDGPLLPAEATQLIPAARRARTGSHRTRLFGHSPREIEQYQELLTAMGALLGSGLSPFR